MMHFLSFLGTEEFYTPIVVLLEWVIDTRLARLFTILMGVGFYFTTFMKNILRLPRPPSPPVQVLETTYDWSLPSLHSVIGVMLPWYICLYIYQHYQLLNWEIFTMVTLITFWSTSVSFSRLYLGVHSPADIVSGVVPGTLMLLIYLSLDDTLDTFITSGSFVILKTLLFYIIMLRIHPASGSPTHSYGETVICNSVAFGFVLATTRTVSSGNYYYALMEQAEREGIRTPPSLQLILLAVGRVLIGFPVVLITRVVFKALTKFSVRKICKLLGVECYSYSEYRKVTSQLNKHYTSGFSIPPIWPKEKEDDGHKNNGTVNGHHKNGDSGHGDATNGYIAGEKPVSNGASANGKTALHNGAMPFDVDTPTKFVTYTMMAWVATEWMHVGFHAMGLHMIP